MYFQTVDDFATRLKSRLRDNPRYSQNVDKNIMPEGYLEAPLAYDAIWAIALGKVHKHKHRKKAIKLPREST